MNEWDLLEQVIPPIPEKTLFDLSLELFDASSETSQDFLFEQFLSSPSLPEENKSTRFFWIESISYPFSVPVVDPPKKVVKPKRRRTVTKSVAKSTKWPLISPSFKLENFQFHIDV